MLNGFQAVARFFYNRRGKIFKAVKKKKKSIITYDTKVKSKW